MQATFDTAAAVRRMESQGISRKHAEAIVETAREAADREDLATKADLSELEARLTWRLFVVVGVVNGLLFAALKLAP
jgi:hypothetical protein